MFWKVDKRNRKREATDRIKGKSDINQARLSTHSVGHVDMTIADCCPMFFSWQAQNVPIVLLMFYGVMVRKSVHFFLPFITWLSH